MRRRDGRTGRYEDPDLVPIMNLVCVLIPLVLWTTTWISYGQITVTRGAAGVTDDGGHEQLHKLRLVAVLTGGSITLLADRAVASRVMPEDAATGTKGRVDIPHRSLDLEAIRAERGACSPPAGPDDFDECAYWGYLERFVGICFESPSGSVRVPDLEAFAAALRGIKDRVRDELGDELADADRINIKAEDGVPYCQVVALMDFARQRRFAWDWASDADFRAGVDEALSRGSRDPFLEPEQWNEAMRRELLFPVVGFVN